MDLWIKERKPNPCIYEKQTMIQAISVFKMLLLDFAISIVRNKRFSQLSEIPKSQHEAT